MASKLYSNMRKKLFSFFLPKLPFDCKMRFYRFFLPNFRYIMKYKNKSSLTLSRRKWRKRKRKGFVSTDAINRTHFKPKETEENGKRKGLVSTYAINRTHFKPKETTSQNNLIVVTKSQFPISPFSARKWNRSPLISPLTRVKVDLSKKWKWSLLKSHSQTVALYIDTHL